MKKVSRSGILSICAVLAMAVAIVGCGHTVSDADVRKKFRYLPVDSEQREQIQIELYQKAKEICGTAMNVRVVSTKSRGVNRDATSVTCHYPIWMAGLLKPDPAS